VPWQVWVVLFLVGSFCSLFLVFFVFWGLGVVGICGLALVVPVYTSCVLKGALRFL
jgi:hypothetical protein